MRRRGFFSLTLIFCLVAGPAFAQQPAKSTQDTDAVAKISTSLVQIDVVVTDKNGKPVTGLTADDFEIFENKKPQPITNFSYVALQPIEETAVAPLKNAQGAPLVPPARLRPEQVRRTFALVVDDLSLSAESTNFVRDALRKFVTEQMQPGDLVAIVRTGAGIGALQQFTSDKRQLLAAIERVRWNPIGRTTVNAVPNLTNETPINTNIGGVTSGVPAPANENFADLRDSVLTAGTLGAVGQVVRGLRDLPGRKSILLFSDGFQLFNINNLDQQRIRDVVRGLTDLANRASVVLYPIDARGLQPLEARAGDSFPQNPNELADDPAQGRSSPGPGQSRGAIVATGQVALDRLQAVANRRAAFLDSQSGLGYLAKETGGFAILNNNDIGSGIKQVLDDQRGYYVIGYVPDEKTVAGDKAKEVFHALTVKVKRSGLTVRSRRGFYGLTDEAARPVAKTPADQLLNALVSPFGDSGIGLRLTSLYLDQPGTPSSVIRSMLHINGKDVVFTPKEDGWHECVLDLLAVTFGDNGQIVDKVSKNFTIRARDASLRQSVEGGLVYNLDVPIKAAGGYQLRIAVRDAASQKIGSSSQFVEIPNLAKNRLTLSGIGMSAVSLLAGGDATVDPNMTPAVRRFRTGADVAYGFFIYNAKPDAKQSAPMVRTILYRDGKPVFTGAPEPVDLAGQPDLQRISVGKSLRLGKDLPPGEYVLQVVATDGAGKDRTASRWIDFEILP